MYEGCCMEDAKAVVGNREINPKNVAEKPCVKHGFFISCF